MDDLDDTGVGLVPRDFDPFTIVVVDAVGFTDDENDDEPLPADTHFSCRRVTENMAWDRDDLAFISVDPVARFRVPI